MKRIICALLASATLTMLLVGCGTTSYKEPPEVGFLIASQFTGYKLGTVKDLVPKKIITDNIDSPEIVNFSSADKGLDALRNKKIHGMVLPAVYAKNELKKSSDFQKLHVTFIEKELRALSLASFESSIVVDAALTFIRDNGTTDKIATAHSPYSNATDDPYTRPTDYVRYNGHKITIGICSDDAFPYNYRDSDGSLIGINVDVAHEIAAYMGVELVIKEYTENDLMSALDRGDVDVIMSQFSPSEENRISIKYIASHPYCDASTYILIRSPRADA